MNTRVFRSALSHLLVTTLVLLLAVLAALAAPAALTAGYVKATVAPWYLAEGCTEGGMETWVLVQNPGTLQVEVDLDFFTGTGFVEGPQGVPIPPLSRTSFNLGSYVTAWEVSTAVTAYYGQVVCERAVYGNERAWAHESIGAKTDGPTWYLAEGCTGEGFETFVLVMNTEAIEVTVDITFMTSAGMFIGPQDYPIPAGSRRTFKANEFVTDWDVSTIVGSTGGNVVCERAVYGNGRAWAHDSLGSQNYSTNWYLPEGCTGPGFETWVLVQNPRGTQAVVDLFFFTSAGKVDGPQDVFIPAFTRRTFNVADYVTDYNVSTQVVTNEGSVVCERAMYDSGRNWAHDSIGSVAAFDAWLLAEGCTGEGFETWVLVQNATNSPSTVNVDFMTSAGLVSLPELQGVVLPGYSRASFNVADYVTDYNVSTRVTAVTGHVICERAMYDTARTWAHDSIGYGYNPL